MKPPVEAWGGSNADIGTFAEVDEELRHRVVLQDDNLLRFREAEHEYLEAMEAYLTAYAVTLQGCPSQWPTAKKEREAKTVNYRERIRFEKAQLGWESAKLHINAQSGLINAVQTRGANIRRQADLDGRSPEWSARDNRGEMVPPPDGKRRPLF